MHSDFENVRFAIKKLVRKFVKNSKNAYIDSVNNVNRDGDSIKLRKFLKLFDNLKSKDKFLFSCWQKNSNGESNMHRQDFSSSGFFSDCQLNPANTIGVGSIRSDASQPRVRESVTSSIQPSPSDLISLWGDVHGSSRGGNASSNCTTCRPGSNAVLPKPSNRSTISEAELLRELVFVLNGASGNYIKYDMVQDAFRISNTLSVPIGQQDAINRLAECGWLHEKIKQFVSGVQNDRTAGAMLQSFASGLHEQLTEYYRLVANLESQLNSNQDKRFQDSRDSVADLNGRFSKLSKPDVSKTDASLVRTYDNPSPPPSSSNVSNQLTLTRLRLWLHEPRFRLRFLASLCDVCRESKGGALASTIFAYSQHGSSEVQFMMNRLLNLVSSCLMHYISQWIYDGQLNDPYQEFFIQSDVSVKTDRLWYDKYYLRFDMIPDFITMEQADKILVTGKSINFLIYVCGEKQGIKNRESIKHTRIKRVDSIFEQDLDLSFDHMISSVYKQTSQYLLETLIEKYHFLDHLRAMRQFLLLGQGDFIQHLMDLLDSDLSKPYSQILTHHLSSTLETAIRDTNAQYEQPEILQRLRVRLLDISSAEDTGWDVFSLDYHVDGPLATIFTSNCQYMYLFSFNFLWRAKRMEFLLSHLWKQSPLRFCCCAMQSDLAVVSHLIQLYGSEIRHFIQQLQYYINFEVLECAWEILVKQINSATALCHVIDAHHSFLTNVFTRCLLDAESRQLLGQLRAVFNSITDYAQLCENFNLIIEDEMALREQYGNDINRYTKLGDWITKSKLELQETARRQQFNERILSDLQARIRIEASAYRASLIRFIAMLNGHSEPTLRFLGDHLNFNDHYEPHINPTRRTSIAKQILFGQGAFSPNDKSQSPASTEIQSRA